jgi:hypothetical protein
VGTGSDYAVNLLEGWDTLTDALHQQAIVQLRTLNLAQYAVGTLMATYAIKLLMVPALSFVQGERCPLNTPSILPQYSLNTPSILPQCSLNTPSILPQYSLNTPTRA